MPRVAAVARETCTAAAAAAAAAARAARLARYKKAHSSAGTSLKCNACSGRAAWGTWESDKCGASSQR
eukprot:CAMPEP_0179032908 /NCGR_PEP_ID=MMETSP0796-20121207/11831_1 /TAXON_ID=73915 /ORGANISM="Pyrodinium bahamense, Strain pbaha01" /LENGTH=67 /DNA_ID=CAMNT_0020729151 /DNA_START=62 /DNA_END=265 /DNA_ORIENTATION=-